MDYQFFINLGFSKAEIDIYIAILKHGPCKTGIIIEKTGLVSSTVYHLMSKLLERGIITFVFEGDQKVYQAEPPEVFETLMETYKADYQSLKKELNEMVSESKTPQRALVYRGIKGFYSAMNDILQTLKAGEEYYFLHIPKAYFTKYQGFFKLFHQRRENKGIKVKGIYPKEMSSIVKETFRECKIAKLKETAHPHSPGMIIYGEKVLIFDLSETPTVFVLQSKAINESYSEYFESIWNEDK